MFDVLAAGFLIGLTHAMPPGPITFEVLKRGMTEGMASAIKVDIGAVTADAIFFILIVAGLSQVLSHPAGKVALWILGCSLLTFLGLRGIYGFLRKKQATIKERSAPPLATGFMICISSPFAIVWWTGVFAGAMYLGHSNDIPALLQLFVGIALACLLWYGMLALISSAGKRMIKEKWLKALSLLCSLMMLAFAVILFYSGYKTFLS